MSEAIKEFLDLVMDYIPKTQFDSILWEAIFTHHGGQVTLQEIYDALADFDPSVNTDKTKTEE